MSSTSPSGQLASDHLRHTVPTNYLSPTAASHGNSSYGTRNYDSFPFTDTSVNVGDRPPGQLRLRGYLIEDAAGPICPDRGENLRSEG
ncbi:hypothetical protein CGCS363_v013344 [Colletotrichum siamense]|uniref:uncharacterized protein n=1 Tax=Colletotrichum siamense TaxID=690259 RepID=UPI001872EC17|nr:uncharacterized protein CGCS363_v013344 [Colletotrichum siamense]KAF5486751.1 hypothetical protein CGCS363_v013344 [Colletotrichum siamense]